MTETQFIKKNSHQWKALEELLTQSNKDPDELHALFIKVSSDLSYARTYFPNRSVRIYLNNLTQEVFDSIRTKEKKAKFSGFFKFFTETLPIEVYKARTTFYVALAIFLCSFLIGVVSTMNNEDFTRDIIGDQYVNMTEANIDKGDPMAVYKDEDMVEMTLAITFNNIRVAFFAFVLGLLGGVGTIYIMVYNGIMVGTFQYFFINKGLFLTSFLTIWIHGTIEISAIIIAGAAGLTLGSGILFPGTYPRVTSLQIAARRAMIIILGTVPLFIIAGLLESFVTRETGLPDPVRAGIIIFSFLFIVAMWIVLPWRVSRSSRLLAMAQEIPPQHIAPFVFKKRALRTFGQNINAAFHQFRMFIGLQYKYIIVPTMLIVGIIMWVHFSSLETNLFELQETALGIFSWSQGGPFIFLLYWIALSTSLMLLSNYSVNGYQSLQNVKESFRIHFWKFMAMVLIWLLPIYFIDNFWISFVIILLITPQFIIITTDRLGEEDGFNAIVRSSLKLSWKRYSVFFPVMIMSLAIAFVIIQLTNSTVTGLIVDFFTWHEVFEFKAMDNAFINHILSMIGYMTLLPLVYFMFVNQYYSDNCKRDASDLRERLTDFGQGSSIMESR